MSAAPLPGEVNLKLTGDEITSITAHLMKFPAEQVYGLLKKIEQQCMDQANAAAALAGGSAA